MKLLVSMLIMLLAGCAGEFDMFTGSEPAEEGWGSPSPTDPTVDPSAPGGPGTVSEPLTPGFAVERNEVKLLPFHIRMQKLGVVSGLALDDPLFDQLWRSRYDLGDHNYGQGIGPDLSWNATKISTWVRAIQPICNSEAMAMRYALPADLSAMMTAAYGREPAADELAEFETATAGGTLDEAGQYEAMCLVVLTSSEFVAL